MDKKDYILEIKNLSSGYNGSLVLHKLNFDVEQGELVAIIGQNGCGKSTLLKSIFQLTPVNTGNIIFKGKEIMHMPTYSLPATLKEISFAFVLLTSSRLFS